MPAVRFSASPPPRRPRSSPGTSSPEAAPAQPVRSALAHPEPSLEATFGLIFQSHERRYDRQDALPPGSLGEPSPRHSATEISALKRRSHPPRPPRPTSAALQGAQAYLDATVRPSTMRLKDVEAWVEDSLHAQAQAMYSLSAHTPLDVPAKNAHRCSAPESPGDWPAFEQMATTSDARMKRGGGEPAQRMKSSSFSSALGKKLVRSPSDLMTWLRSPSVQGSASRSRSISQATEPHEEEQAALADRRWSSSSRNRMLRLSDGSQRALPTPNTPPSYRSVFTGLHRRFYSNDADSDSDSSWTSFGCVDGMRRPDIEQDPNKRQLDGGMDNVVKGASVILEGPVAEDVDPEEAGDDVNLLNPSISSKASSLAGNKPKRHTLKRIVSRFEVPVRQTRPYMESDTACMMPY